MIHGGLRQRGAGTVGGVLQIRNATGGGGFVGEDKEVKIYNQPTCFPSWRGRHL